MTTKREELEMANAGKGCLGKATDEEPVFILRAQDALAPSTVEYWADQLEKHGRPSSRDKIDEARSLAREMRDWQDANTSKIPD